MRQAGRYLPEYRNLRLKFKNFLDFCFHSEAASEATLQPVMRFDVDAAIIFSDILTIPFAAGQEVRFVEGEGPVLEELAFEELVKRVSHLSQEGLASTLAPVYQAIKQVRRELSPEKSLIGFAGAPWTLACYMISRSRESYFLQARSRALSIGMQLSNNDEEDFFARNLLMPLADAVADHLIFQGKAGADCLQVFDSWAGLVPRHRWDAWIVEPSRRIFKRVRLALPNTKLIWFGGAKGLPIKAYSAFSGTQGSGWIDFVDGFGIGYGQNLGEVRTVLERAAVVAAVNEQQDSMPLTHPKPMAIQGNIDPAALLAGGSVLREQVLRIREEMKGWPHIFNLGHGVDRHTSPDDVACLVEWVREG